MPIKKVHDTIPTAQAETGNPPLSRPLIAHRLAEAWKQQYLDMGYDKLGPAIPAAGPYRASYSGTRCDRALRWKLSGVTPDRPLTLVDFWRLNIGSMIHEEMQAVLPGSLIKGFPGAEVFVEHNVDLRPIGIPGSAHVDVFVKLPFTVRATTEGAPDLHDTRKIVVEIKSINGFGFKTAATSFNGPPEGPRWDAVLQACLAGEALDADEVRIVVLSLEPLGPDVAARHGIELGDYRYFAGEWKYTRSQWQPWVEAEVARVQRIIAGVETNGPIPQRLIHHSRIPGGVGLVTAPSNGNTVVQDADGNLLWSGRSWECGYCPFRQSCIEAGA